MKPSEFVIREHIAARRVHRGRLFRKYFLLILALVCGTLIISGGIGLYFAYQENKVALASLQREKAGAAAARIEEFVRQVEQQLAFAALPHEGVEQRNLEFQKVLRIAQAVTDIAYIDARGREQLVVSRLQMNVVGSGKDRSQEPAFKEARPAQTWFGPVYFRKDTEPYITIAIRSGEAGPLTVAGPVTVADVNLKFIWDVITRIKIGQKGKAYVVDATGHLVADPDIGLVLRKTNLSHLEQVKAALAPDADDSLAMLARDLAGSSVLTAYAPIEPAREQRAQGAEAGTLGWKVFVEQPVSEVFAALDATILRTIALLVAGLLFSALAALSLARSMVRPIATLQEGAARIGAGELDQKIEVHTGDELETLADQFNEMSAQLRESYAGLEKKVEERTAELQQTLEQQTATSEILKVISSSTTNTQPVFDAIVQSGLKLFPDAAVMVGLPDGAHIRLAAIATKDSAQAEAIRSRFPIPLTREYMHATAILDHRLVDVPDGERSDEVALRPGIRNFIASGSRAITIMPMLRGDAAIGAISVTRRAPGPLTDKQIALLRTFADQAVIAIENVRLFNETKEALEQQTATSDILQVTSKSPTDVRPVFDTILDSAIRLCEGSTAVLWSYDGAKLRIGAHKNMTEGAVKHLTENPLEPGDWNPTAQAALERRTVHVLDVFAEPRYRPLVPSGTTNTRPNAGTVLAVPLLRDSELFGVITVWRYEKRLFTEKQLSMINTFAAQAVIAIENVRLFNETKEALEQQTAIAEVLRVISGSPTDVKPVLDAVALRAARICDASDARIILADGAELRLTAGFGDVPTAMRLGDPFPLDRTSAVGRAVLERAVVHIEDILARPESEYARARDFARRAGYRTMLAVPLMREDRPLGGIILRRVEVRPFSEKQIRLLKTFADQAAIAIENVRLFNATQEALEQQTATAEVLNVISGSITDAHPVFDAISRSVLKLYGARHVALYVCVGDKIDRVGYALSDKSADDGSRSLWPIPLDDKSLTGRAILGGELVHIKDVETEPGLSEQSRAITRKSGARSVLIAPMQSMGTTTGALSVARRAAGGFSEREVELLRTFADQAVIAMENVRLFNEIQEKSRQLEIANKHKSDFLANMSHELRTPLNAIIGFSEVLMERMFGEVNAKQADYLKDIHESGKHLLSLINDILDLSKIEAGRMDLELSSFDLPSALSNAMTLVRERAQRHAIALGLEVDPRLGEFRADERKFKQIVLNLLSNAVKFTPDGGRVDVAAKLDTDKVEIAVKDTGIGIAADDYEAVFEEFKQVGRDYTRKAEGTGLGLALTRRFVELHGGTIRLQSTPGKGSTFTITLPLTR